MRDISKFSPFIAVLLLCGGLFCLAQAQTTLPLTGAGKPGGVAAYSGPGDVNSGALAWYGLRAYNNTAANAGPSTTKVAELQGNSTLTNCALFLKGDGTGNVDLTTAGAGGSGNQCSGGATTFCTVTNTFCNITTFYDQSGSNSCSATPCDVVQNAVANDWTLAFSCFGGSLPCIGGNAAAAITIYTSSGTFGTPGSAFTHSYVADRTGNTTTFNTVIACTTGGGTVQTGFGNAANNGLLFAGTVQDISSPAVNDSVLHSLQAVYNGASSLLNVDGTDSATVNPGAANCNSGVSNLGIAGNNFNGFAGEAGFWGTAWNTTQKTNMCHNQRLFWGSTGSC